MTTYIEAIVNWNRNPILTYNLIMPFVLCLQNNMLTLPMMVIHFEGGPYPSVDESVTIAHICVCMLIDATPMLGVWEAGRGYLLEGAVNTRAL